MKFVVQLNINIISLIGKDIKSFLNGIITNSLIGKGVYTFLLSPKGRYLFDFFVHIVNEELFYIEVNKNLSESLIQKLSFYKLGKDIKVQDVTNDLVSLYADQNIIDKFSVISCIKDQRYFKMKNRFICKKSDLSNSGLSITLDKDLYKKDKYSYTIPDGYIDMMKEKSIITEFGVNNLHAIDYSKGCFLGQELIARINSSKNRKKTIFKVISENDYDLGMVKKLSQIFFAEVQVGYFCSGYKNLGIAICISDVVLEYKKKFNNKKIFSIRDASGRKINVNLEKAEWI